VVHAIALLVIALYHSFLTRKGPWVKNRKETKKVEVEVEVKMKKTEPKM